MRERIWLSLVMGLLLITVAACRPQIEEETTTGGTEEAPTSPTPPTMVAQLATATPEPNPTDIPPPPPKPTPQPTSSVVSHWPKVGGERAGLAIQMPLDWVNLSGSLDVSAATNPLGLSVMLLADSERAGRSVLAGKALTDGAFGVGLITNQNLATNDPEAALTGLIANRETAVVPLTQTRPITATAPSGVAPGAMVDLTGDLLGFFNGGGDRLRARLLLFLPPAGRVAQDGRTATLFLFSAPADQWERYADDFDEMARSIVLYDNPAGYTLSAGAANVLGDLTETNAITGKLDQGVKDVWTFTVAEARYATLSLAPIDKELDLSLTIISPSGQTISQVDSGYAGATEIAADLLLMENGRYVIEVRDFFNETGRYTLSLALDEEPRSSAAGVIKPGQSIQSELPVNAQHVWTFDGLAGNLISVVLTPSNNQMDAILNLYGPDGERLVALDEGFSGDAEVISGFELPVTGLYAIRVSSFAGNGGPYALSLDEGGEATENFYDAGDLAYGDVKSETLRNSEAHAWFFEGRAGDAARIAVRPLNELLDLDVWLFDPDIQRLAAQDAFAAGETEVIELTLPQDGQYLILVREFFGEAGNYEIDLSASPAAAPVFAGRVSYGETVAGTLAVGQTDLWQFSGNEDDVIDIELVPGSALADVALELQSPDGVTVLELDATGNGQNETLAAFTVTADGWWGIVIKEFLDEGGAYSLTVQRSR